ncbi:unnamed protein product [Rotaria magnacalcarata]|uniref:Uncharacterized protein n=4 Tax=Rotaria magnacalcarata TaxID=392030 RepID=A0A816LNN2_9BILA|nr:unnamed protein product [Rotaria magnacalcarata]
MMLSLFILFSSFLVTDEKHFNGGTITWAPIDPYDNDTSVGVIVTQTYSWTYPYVQCKNNVPITTTAFTSANANLTCVVDCLSDGGYSSTPINILTDCTWASSSLKMMTSSRAKNVTLSADAHFYIANRGSAWTPLNDPPKAALEWSIVTFIDIRKRPDGFINSAPVPQFISPQYAIVNRTTEITIPVSDANDGDDIRCRWSVYIPGYRRRKRSNDQNEQINHPSHLHSYNQRASKKELIHTREKRAPCGAGGGGGGSACLNNCTNGCSCQCSTCASSLCTGASCTLAAGCMTATTTVATTSTLETLGTLKSTSSYPIRQAIDECGDICYPGSLPNGTILSNCTITFTGMKAGIWYAIAIQVEDFIDSSSTIPMSSVPVQMLIYVLPTPVCSIKPIMLPLTGCLEVQVGVSVSFNISAMNLCNFTVANITDIAASTNINGMTGSNLTSSTTNSSISYVTYTWIPQSNQIGSQKLCFIAFTSENLQSSQYCVQFTVKNSSDICVTTTTSTTATSTTTSTKTTTTTATTSTSTTTTTTATTSTISKTTTTTSTSSTSATSTTSTTSTTATTSTSSTSSSTSTTSMTTTASSSSQISTLRSTDDSSLFVGLGIGLGLPLILAIGITAVCLCCRWCPGAFWRRLRERFWRENPTHCEECVKEYNGQSHENAHKTSGQDSTNYRRQYINDKPRTPAVDYFRQDSLLSSSLSSFETQSMTMTRTTFMSSPSTNIMPSENITGRLNDPSQLSSTGSGGSMLVRAYVAQHRQKIDFPSDLHFS